MPTGQPLVTMAPRAARCAAMRVQTESSDRVRSILRAFSGQQALATQFSCLGAFAAGRAARPKPCRALARKKSPTSPTLPAAALSLALTALEPTAQSPATSLLHVCDTAACVRVEAAVRLLKAAARAGGPLGPFTNVDAVRNKACCWHTPARHIPFPSARCPRAGSLAQLACIFVRYVAPVHPHGGAAGAGGVRMRSCACCPHQRWRTSHAEARHQERQQVRCQAPWMRDLLPRCWFL